MIVTVGEAIAAIARPERDVPLGTCGAFAGPFASGAPMIFASAAARLGAACAPVTVVGDDPFGAAIRAKLEADGADCSRIQVSSGAVTPTAFLAYDSTGAREFLFLMAGSALEGLDVEACAQLPAATRWLHVCGSSLILHPRLRDAVLLAIDIARERAIPISLDPNVRQEPGLAQVRAALRQLALDAEILLPSSGELDALGLSAQDAVDAGVTVFEKRGAAGVIIHDRRGPHAVPAPPQEEVDPDGAGDIFAAAVVATLLRGGDTHDAARNGCRVASRSVGHFGPMESPMGPADVPVNTGGTP